MKLPQFRLRTLFIIVALAGVLMSWVVHQMNWIRQRHEMLTQVLPGEYREYRDYNKTVPAISGLIVQAPWSLRIFGEQGVSIVGVPKSQVKRAEELFPEAKIAAFEPD